MSILPRGRGVEQADRLAHRAAFAGHGGVHVLAAAREVPRPLPLADVLELGAVLHVPGVQGGEAHRFEQVPAVAAGDGAEGHRGVVRAEHGGAGVGDALALGPRGDRQAVDVAQLALVGAEAQRGVALDVLDGLEALAAGQFDGGGGDVVLRIDELLRRARRGLLVGHLEQRDGRFLTAWLDLRQAAGGGLVAGVEGGAAAGLVAVGEYLGEPEHAVHGAGADALLQAFAGDEGEDFLAPLRLAAQVRGQVHDRAVAAGAGDQVAVQPFAAAGAHGLQVDPGDLGAADPLAAASLDHRTAGDHPHAALACFLDPTRRADWPVRRRWPPRAGRLPASRGRRGRRSRCWWPAPVSCPEPRRSAVHRWKPRRRACCRAGRCCRRPAAAHGRRRPAPRAWRARGARAGEPGRAGATSPRWSVRRSWMVRKLWSW
ncbi:Uncharacterised protein [Pseudomonas aeruginosa]|nr:Uncharacterised protein [Pseudomonas aeruginosa]